MRQPAERLSASASFRALRRLWVVVLVLAVAYGGSRLGGRGRRTHEMARVMKAAVTILLLVMWFLLLTEAEAARRTQMRAALRRHAAKSAVGHEPALAEALRLTEDPLQRTSVRAVLKSARRKSTKTARSRLLWRIRMARLSAGKNDAAPDAASGGTPAKMSTRIGSHSVMGMGAPKGSRVDQQLKLKCMVSMWEHRKWSADLLTDVKYTGRGVREDEVNGKVGTIVHRDKVAVALNSEWAERWGSGGLSVTVGTAVGSWRSDSPENKGGVGAIIWWRSTLHRTDQTR